MFPSSRPAQNRAMGVSLTDVKNDLSHPNRKVSKKKYEISLLDVPSDISQLQNYNIKCVGNSGFHSNIKLVNSSSTYECLLRAAKQIDKKPKRVRKDAAKTKRPRKRAREEKKSPKRDISGESVDNGKSCKKGKSSIEVLFKAPKHRDRSNSAQVSDAESSSCDSDCELGPLFPSESAGSFVQKKSAIALSSERMTVYKPHQRASSGENVFDAKVSSVCRPHAKMTRKTVIRNQSIPSRKSRNRRVCEKPQRATKRSNAFPIVRRPRTRMSVKEDSKFLVLGDVIKWILKWLKWFQSKPKASCMRQKTKKRKVKCFGSHDLLMETAVLDELPGDLGREILESMSRLSTVPKRRNQRRRCYSAAYSRKTKRDWSSNTAVRKSDVAGFIRLLNRKLKQLNESECLCSSCLDLMKRHLS